MVQQKYLIHNYFSDNKNKRSYLFNYIASRLLKRDGHINILISGRTGTGKSWGALKINEIIDHFFNVNRIVWSVKEYSMLMKHPFKSGSAFLFEEAQHGAHNRNYFSKDNKGLFYLLSTLRHRNYLTCFTLPERGTIDKQSLELMHIHLISKFIDTKNKRTYFELYIPNKSYFKDKVYYNNMTIRQSLGTCKVKGVWIHKPSDELLKAYKVKKYNFTKNLSSHVAMGLEDAETKEIARIRKDFKGIKNVV